jgi:hypothetical protein
MKIPRRRQDAHVARMADFLGGVVRVLAAVVIQRLDQRRTGRLSLAPRGAPWNDELK